MKKEFEELKKVIIKEYQAKLLEEAYKYKKETAEALLIIMERIK